MSAVLSPPTLTRRLAASRTTEAWSCTVRLVVADPTRLPAAFRDLDLLLRRVDAAASRFRPDSALSMANARAGSPTAVPPLLLDLVGVAIDAAQRTAGLVDPTIGRALVALGYDRDIADIGRSGGAPASNPAEPDAAEREADWRDVRFDRLTGLLTVPAGTALDLGATTKAYTADLAARMLHRIHGTPVLVEIGGDLAVAGPAGDGWPVRVAERAGEPGPVVRIRHGGLATSTTTVRRWQHGGEQVHHIVDPVTGRPADGPLRTATVYAQSALAANTASTAAIVLGERAVGWLDDHRLAARLVRDDGVVVTTAGWPA